jgi:hypothetical protein
MLTVLTGISYTLPRMVGIKSEMWATVTGKEPPITDTQFATGNVVTNSLTGEIGLLLDTEDVYFSSLGEPHSSRLVEVVEGDGWNDVIVGE